MPLFDVVVCGLGAMGSATLYHLAGRGKRVLGIERYAPGHERGSSHGASRIIRLAYFEHPSYVPLLRHAYRLWRELEQTSGQKLLHITGILEIGSQKSALVRGTLASARLHGLEHEVLAASELMRRFPAFEIPADYLGVFQPDGGWLAVESAFQAWISQAMRAGAQVRTGDMVYAIEELPGAVRIRSNAGTIEAGAAVVCVGPWTRALLPRLAAPLRVTRQVMAWFKAAPSWPALPVFLLESAHGVHYGIPPECTNSAGMKVAKHHHRDETIDADNYDRTISHADETVIRAALADHLPAANGRLLAAKTCLYTMTPDGDFVIDRLPGSPHIVVASPCSGHGFKFAPVVGEILADLVTHGQTRHDITRFRLGRFDEPT
jgi:sarcosine oxidase